MRAAVAGVAVLRRLGTKRTLLAEADGFELIARNTERNESIFSRGRTAVAQYGEVVFRGTAFIAVALNRYDEIGIHLEDRFESSGVTLKNCLVFGANFALVVVKVNVLHLAGEDFLDGLLRSPLNLRRRWWRAYRNGRIGGHSASRTRGGEVVSGGGRGINAAAAISAHFADAIINRDRGGIRDRPAEGRRLAHGYGGGLGAKVADNGLGSGCIVFRHRGGCLRRQRRNFLFASGREPENEHCYKGERYFLFGHDLSHPSLHPIFQYLKSLFRVDPDGLFVAASLGERAFAGAIGVHYPEFGIGGRVWTRKRCVRRRAPSLDFHYAPHWR